MALSVRYWDRMSARDISLAREYKHTYILIPIGVIEAHGPFLPLGFDAMMARLVAHLVAERLCEEEVQPLILDGIPYSGVVGATDGLTGTITYPACLSTEILFRSVQQIYQQGFSCFSIINGDAGTGRSLIPFLFRATSERQEFFRSWKGTLSLATWFDGILNVGHASTIEHAFYTYICEYADLHTREVAASVGMTCPLNREALKQIDGTQRVYPQPRREFFSWQPLEGQESTYGVSDFSLERYEALLQSGTVGRVWQKRLTEVYNDISGLVQKE